MTIYLICINVNFEPFENIILHLVCKGINVEEATLHMMF